MRHASDFDSVYGTGRIKVNKQTDNNRNIFANTLIQAQHYQVSSKFSRITYYFQVLRNSFNLIKYYGLNGEYLFFFLEIYLMLEITTKYFYQVVFNEWNKLIVSQDNK